MTSAREDRHLLRMAVNDPTASSKHLAARWSTATGVLIRSNLLRIEGNHNCKRDVREALQSQVIPFLQDIPRPIFQQVNERPHVAKTVRNFCSAQHMQLLPWPAYLPDRLPIEHVWDLVRKLLARFLHPAASKVELLLCIQAVWNSLPQADI
ncbi:transposable element Tcb2 transposase [Trichonephila clavipes]|nr:transposable element Tcb2 transposase [Trichonephila clavipes]